MRLSRAILLTTLCAAFGSAQGLVTINGTWTRADGSLYSGQFTISWQDFTAADGTPVARGSKNVQLTSGVPTQTIQLFPNVGATPAGTSYVVRYNLSGSSPFTRQWYVPASLIPVNFQAIEFPPQGLVGQTAIVSPAQLTQAGATVNQPLCWNGAMWAPGNCGGGGGGPGGATNSVQINNGLGGFAGISAAGANTLLHGTTPPSFGPVVNGDIADGTIDVTRKITGIVPVANGGTGTQNQFAQGSVVFTGIAGVFQQDNGRFFWNSATHQLGIGTTTTTAPITVLGGNAGATAIQLSGLTGANINIGMTDGNGNHGWTLGATTSSTFDLSDITRLAIPLRVTGSGDTLLCAQIGDQGFTLDVQCSGGGGTARFWDQNNTGVVIRKGNAQSANLLSLVDFSGTVQAWVNQTNFAATFPVFVDSGASFALAGSSAGATLTLANNMPIQWSSTVAFSGTKDVGLIRSGVGAVELNNAVPGHRYSTQLQTGGSLVYDNTPLTGMTQSTWQAGAGQAANGLLRVLNNGGVVLSGVDSAGDYFVVNAGAEKAMIATGGFAGPGMYLSSDSVLTWSNITDLSGGAIGDLGLRRNAPGVLELDNGNPGALRDLTLRNITINGTCNGCPGSTVAPYTQSISSLSSVTISAATHNRGTFATATAIDNSGNSVFVSYVNAGCPGACTGNLTFTFNPAFSGLIVIRQ